MKQLTKLIGFVWFGSNTLIGLQHFFCYVLLAIISSDIFPAINFPITRRAVNLGGQSKLGSAPI
jgi:hypothetical protein